MKTLVLFDIGRVLVTLDFSRFYAHLSRVSPLAPSDIEQRLAGTGYMQCLDSGRDDLYHATLRHALALDHKVSDAYLTTAYLSLHTGPNAQVVDLKARVMRTTAVGLLSNSHRLVRAHIEDRWPGTLRVNGPSAFSDTLQTLKPTQGIYESIANTADRIIFIDDHPENLVYPATMLGWHCIRYSEFLADAAVPEAIRVAPTYHEARNASELEDRLRDCGVLMC